MTFDLDIGHATHPGSRPVNEDFAGVARPPAYDPASGLIAAIADGVSTGGGGREAAQTTVLSVVSDFHGAPDTWDISVVLDRLIGAQNAWLVDHNRRRQSAVPRDSSVGAVPRDSSFGAVPRDSWVGAVPRDSWVGAVPRDSSDGAVPRNTSGSQIGMTTLTALVLRGQVWTVAHVGDTRAWLLRDGVLAQLTQDHAFDEEFQRSRLTRAMGLDDSVRIDFEQGELRRGDVFVLTTDGVHGRVTRAQLARLAAADDASAAARAIVDAAVRAGSRDNATALVVRVVQLIAGRFDDSLLARRDLPVPRRLAAGDVLDGHEILGLLADTGTHRLYRARTATDGATVVVKTLPESLAGSAQDREMLVHEAWLAERIGVAPPPRGEAGFVRARATPGATALYIVFDWHPGSTLEEMLQKQLPEGLPEGLHERLAAGRRFEVADIVDAVLALARALARLHRLGVVHRDIKPGNLHLGEDGIWRILDLGAAVSGSDSAEIRQRPAGTPSYMNREQWGLDAAEPAPADAASDIYALGVTLYQWLTTKLPYGEVEAWQAGRFRRDPKPPSRLRPEVPIWLDHIVLKAVALERARRFDTAEELVLALERAASRPLGAPRPTPLVARDPTALWKIALGASLLFNGLLVYWLLFLPR